jgi:hypothetical protein
MIWYLPYAPLDRLRAWYLPPDSTWPTASMNRSIPTGS